MKTIEERADIASDIAKREFEEDSYWSHYADDIVTSAFSEGFYKGYFAGAIEQKAIDDAEIERLKVAWSQEAKITHNDEMNYQQGFHDAKDITICKACAWICDNCEVEHCEFDGGSKCPTLKSLREYMER